MKYFIIDNEGTTYGECNEKAEAEFMVDVFKDSLRAKGKTEAQIEALELAVFEMKDGSLY